MAIDPFSPAKTDHRLGGRAAVNPSRACGEPTESVIRMCESRFDEKVLRPTLCPFCSSRHIDPAVATIITVKTSWHCRDCDRTWTPASRVGLATREH